MKQIETNRLILRRFELSDVSIMFKNWASNPNVTKYLTWPAHEDIETTRAVIESWIEGYNDIEDSKMNWAIVLKEIDEPIGSIGVVRTAETENESGIIRTADIGYCIGEKWWHQGITAEALKVVIQYLFDEKDYDRIIAGHDTENPNSGRVMQKAGMKFDRIAYGEGQNNRGRIDVALYSINKEDWKHSGNNTGMIGS